MAGPTLRQSAGNSCASDEREVRCTLQATTIHGSLVVVWATIASGTVTVTGPAGFTLARQRSIGSLTVAVWYKEDCPPISSVTVTLSKERAMVVRALEYTGAAQSNALDRVTVLVSGGYDDPDSGLTGNSAQTDSIVCAAVGNRYASTQQYGFGGGLAKLAEMVSPQWTRGQRPDLDEFRCRLTVHHQFTSTITSWRLRALLSAYREWITILCIFRGNSTGRKSLASKNAPVAMAVTGRGTFSAFGPLRSTANALTHGGGAWMGLFAHQFMLNGRDGLRIGNSTRYRVEHVEGLHGWELRVSDDDLPRGDGAQRGLDLQSARLITFKVNYDGREQEYGSENDPFELERANDALLRSLRPRRDEDWELIFRDPGQPMWMVRCRPTQLIAELDNIQAIKREQSFVLRASDPRLYSASAMTLQVPVVPAAASSVPLISAVNLGNARAYPTIRIIGAPSVEVSRIELVNATTDVTFDVSTPLPARSTLIGDMPARITAAPRSVVTVDGQSRYGGWAAPREPFFLAPAPEAPAGANALYLRTTPAGAPVTCVLDWRHTSYG